jgi:hypothetical protein
MSYTIEKLPNEPIIVQVLNEDYTFGNEAAPSMAELTKLLDAQPEPVWLIMDMSAISLSLDDAIQAASMSTQQFKLLKHRNAQESILVSDSRLIKLMAQGMNAPIFGNITLKTFETRGAALAYARTQAGAKRK